MVGHGTHELPAARTRHRTPLERRAEHAWRDQPGARVRPHRRAAQRLRHHRRPGERPGRTRARPEVRSASGMARHQQSRAPEVHRRRLGNRRTGSPGPGRRRVRDVPEDRRGRDQRPGLDLLQSDGLAARQHVRRPVPREAGVLCGHRLLPERHRVVRGRRASRQPAGRGRGHGDAGRRPHHQDQQGRGLPGRRAAGLAHHPGPRRGLSAGRADSRSPNRARSSRSCGSPRRAASPTTRA